MWCFCRWFVSKYDIGRRFFNSKAILSGRLDMVHSKSEEFPDAYYRYLHWHACVLAYLYIWCGLWRRTRLLHYDAIRSELQRSQSSRLALRNLAHCFTGSDWSQSTFPSQIFPCASISLFLYNRFVYGLATGFLLWAKIYQDASSKMADFDYYWNRWEWISIVRITRSASVDIIRWTGNLVQRQINSRLIILLSVFSTNDRKSTHSSYATTSIIVLIIWNAMKTMIWLSADHVNKFWTVALIRRQASSVSIKMSILRAISQRWWCERDFPWSQR